MATFKLTYIGPMQERNGKSFREIGAEGWDERKSAWKTAPDFDKYKVGDSVDLLISDNGKYINFVKPAGGGSRPTGGKGWSKSGSPAADPEKNVSVYTSYVLEYLIAPHQKTQLSIPDAVQLVFDIRKAVAAKFAGDATKGESATTPAESGIKVDTALALVKQVHADADDRVWKPYINSTLNRKGAYDLLMKNLNACLAGEKMLDYTPDDVPVFSIPGE